MKHIIALFFILINFLINDCITQTGCDMPAAITFPLFTSISSSAACGVKANYTSIITNFTPINATMSL